MSRQRFNDKPPLLVPVLLLALYTTAVLAALEKGGGDCSAGADQAAKNDICGGPTKGFCVDSKTSKAACACFDAYEGPLCQTLAAPTTSSTGSSNAGKNALTALALGLGGAYLLNSLTNQQGFRNNNMDQYLLSGTVNPYLAAQNAAATASSLDGFVGTDTGAAFPFPVNTGGSYPLVLTGPPQGKFKG